MTNFTTVVVRLSGLPLARILLTGGRDIPTIPFSGLVYHPLRRFLQSWKSIDSLTISAPNVADSACVSNELLRDAAALGIEKVSVRCQRAAGITDEGILDFWLSATSRSLEVVRPAISQDFLPRLVQVCVILFVFNAGMWKPFFEIRSMKTDGIRIIFGKNRES